MTDILVVKRLIDYVGLGARGLPEGYLRLGKDVALTLALNEAMGPDGASLMNVDAAGNLRVTMALQTAIGQVIPVLDSAPTRPMDSSGNLGDVNVGFNLLANEGYLFNGATNDRMREASAANLSATSGLGVQLTAAPGEWGVFDTPAVGVALNATKAAGGAGVRHVARAVTIAMSSQAAIALSTITFQLYDGGAFPWKILFDLPAAIVAPFAVTFNLNYVGAPAAVMAIQSTPAVAGLRVSGSLLGYDAS